MKELAALEEELRGAAVEWDSQGHNETFVAGALPTH